MAAVDTAYKMYFDTPRGKDPDTYSRTLYDYHRILWSKPLPCGDVFSLTAGKSAPYYLHHNSDLGSYRLSSDCFGHTYSSSKRMAAIVNAIPAAELNGFIELCSTIGSYIIFPANRIDNRATINGARGMNRWIGDRFDLTLECIRRWYSGIGSPLYVHLDRYNRFFQLFNSFEGYIKFFLLDDFIDTASGSVFFWLPFSDFGQTDPLPADVGEYRQYMKNLSALIAARNARIAKWAEHPA